MPGRQQQVRGYWRGDKFVSPYSRKAPPAARIRAHLEEHPTATAVTAAGLSATALAAAGVLSPVGLVMAMVAGVAAVGYRRHARRPGRSTSTSWRAVERGIGGMRAGRKWLSRGLVSTIIDAGRRSAFRLTGAGRLGRRRKQWEVDDLKLRARAEETDANFAELHSRRKSLIERRRALLLQADSPSVRAELDGLAAERRAMFAEWVDLSDETHELGRDAGRHARLGHSLEAEADRREAAPNRKPLVLRLLEADRRALVRFEEWKAADERRYHELRGLLGLGAVDDEPDGGAPAIGVIDKRVAELWDMCWGDWPPTG